MSTDEQPHGHPQGPYLRSGEVAATLRVSTKAVIGWARRGLVPHIMTMGGHLRIPQSWLTEFPQGPYLKGVEVASIFRVAPSVVTRWADQGRMEGAFRTPGGHVRIPESWLKEQLSTAGDPQPPAQ